VGKYTFLRVDDQAMLTKAEKNLPEMKTVLDVVFAGHLQIILVGEAELQLVLYPVNLALESVAGVLQAERHAGVLKQPKRSGDRCLADVVRMNRNLMVPLAEVYLGKNRTAGGDVGEIKHIRQRVRIRFCNQIEPPEIAARSPAAVRLLHHMKG
jgi:hypothetical protein